MLIFTDQFLYLLRVTVALLRFMTVILLLVIIFVHCRRSGRPRQPSVLGEMTLTAVLPSSSSLASS